MLKSDPSSRVNAESAYVQQPPRGGVQETQAPSQRHRDGAAVCFVDGQLALSAANISDPLARVRHETPPFPFRARDSSQPTAAQLSRLHHLETRLHLRNGSPAMIPPLSKLPAAACQKAPVSLIKERFTQLTATPTLNEAS